MENYAYNLSSYAGSGHSSPRSREIEFENPTPWEENNHPPTNYKVKFMCSYGGKILPRPQDHQLSYIGGETKIVAVDRTVKFANLLAKLVALCDCDSITFKYQLPGEDLDALISVTSDDDLEHLMHEYDRLFRVSANPVRLRIFIFQSTNLGMSVCGFGSGEGKSDKERFVEALNSAPATAPVIQAASPASAGQIPPPSSNVDFLFGLDKENPGVVGARPMQQPAISTVQEVEDLVVSPGIDEKLMAVTDPIQKHIQDLQRLRIEEQQGFYRRKSDDTLSGLSAGTEYYNGPEKIPHVAVPGGVSYWAAEKQVSGGAYTSNTTLVTNDQPIYVIPTPSSTFHPPAVRPITATPASAQGCYTVQRMPPEVYRDPQQQQVMYNMIPSGGVPPMAPLQSHATGFPDSLQMMRSVNTAGVGMLTEAPAPYAPVAYESGAVRPIMYSAPMGSAAQYHVLAGAEARQTVVRSTTEGTGKVVKTQASV